MIKKIFVIDLHKKLNQRHNVFIIVIFLTFHSINNNYSLTIFTLNIMHRKKIYKIIKRIQLLLS